jgi:hypothetical protein
METIEQAGKLRCILLQAHDALSVGLESLRRAIVDLEQAWPALGSNGRVGQHADHDDRGIETLHQQRVMASPGGALRTVVP